MLNAPPTGKSISTLQAPLPAGTAPPPTQPTPNGDPPTLGVLKKLDLGLQAILKALAPLQPVESPQGVMVIESASGNVISQPFVRQNTYLVLEVYGSGPTPSATVTVLDSSKGGTATTAADPQAIRLLTAGYTKYILGGLQDEITIRVAPTAGTWAVRASWTDGSPGTAGGGLTPHSRLLTADTNLVSVKASIGQVYAIQAFNVSASAFWLKLYNKASAPVIASDAALIQKRILVPANATAANGAGVTLEVTDLGIVFSSGIAYACTRGVADTDTTATAANDGVINLDYK